MEAGVLRGMASTFSPGDVVNVLPRQWSGINREGGAARVTKVNVDESTGNATVAVAYIVGTEKDASVPIKFVKHKEVEPVSGRASRSSTRSTRGARSIKPPKQFDETTERVYEDLKEKEARFPLERLGPGVSNFLWHQVREMERIISKIEKEDAVALFYGKHDPVTLMEQYRKRINKANGTVGSGQQGRTVEASSGIVTRGWLSPARKNPDRPKDSSKLSSPSAIPKANQNVSKPPKRSSWTAALQHEGDGKWDEIAGQERQGSGLGKAEDALLAGRGEHPGKVSLKNGVGETGSGRKRPRKGSGDATKTRRQSADEGQDRPPSPTVRSVGAMDVEEDNDSHRPPPPPPPVPPSLAASSTAVTSSQDHANPREEQPTRQEHEQQHLKQSHGPDFCGQDSKAFSLDSSTPSMPPPLLPLSLPGPPPEAASRGPPVNLTQLRERFVNRYYLPSLETYLPQPTPIAEVLAAMTSGGEDAGSTGCDTSESTAAEAASSSTKGKSLRGSGSTPKRGSRKKAAGAADKKDPEGGAQKRPTGGGGGGGGGLANKKPAAPRGANKKPSAKGANKRPIAAAGKQPAVAASTRPRGAETDKNSNTPATLPAPDAPKSAAVAKTTTTSATTTATNSGVDSAAPGSANKLSAAQLAVLPKREVKPLPDKHLPPEATLSFDYEPMCDWEGIRKDIRGMVDRLVVAGGGVTGAGDAEGDEKGDGKTDTTAREDKGKLKGAAESGDETADEDEARAGVEELVAGAKKWLKLAEDELKRANDKFERQRFGNAVKRSIQDYTDRSTAAAYQGVLRTEPFPLRVYQQYLTEYLPASDLPSEEREIVNRELDTNLETGYMGQAYSYDDHGLSEQWMQNYMGETSSASAARKAADGARAPAAGDTVTEGSASAAPDASGTGLGAVRGATAQGAAALPQKEKLGSCQLNDEGTRVQVEALLLSMLTSVVDKVNNEAKVLEKPPKVLGKDLEEVSVWGIDCYTRNNVEYVLDLTRGLSKARSRSFIQRSLLPALNRQRGPEGVDMRPALRDLVHGGSGGPKATGEHLEAATALLDTINALENLPHTEVPTSLARAWFHCHPKGTGVVCKDPNGIRSDTFVSEYLGEVYPAWRWCQKLRAVEEAKLKHGLKPDLPDFYNLVLERPREDARGYSLLYIEAGNHVGNFSSSLSHSCNANCTTTTAARNGRLCVTLTATRDIAYGEELTMDYGAITSCETEYNKAVCLCGSSNCRASFMQYTGTRALDEVLRDFGPLMTFKTLIQSAADTPLSEDEEEALHLHGFGSSALGDNCPTWLKKFAAMQLRYVEYERRRLPPALLQASDEYTQQTADSESRGLMERRVQSLVDVLSSVYHFLQKQKDAALKEKQARAAVKAASKRLKAARTSSKSSKPTASIASPREQAAASHGSDALRAARKEADDPFATQAKSEHGTEPQTAPESDSRRSPSDIAPAAALPPPLSVPPPLSPAGTAHSRNESCAGSGVDSYSESGSAAGLDSGSRSGTGSGSSGFSVLDSDSCPTTTVDAMVASDVERNGADEGGRTGRARVDREAGGVATAGERGVADSQSTARIKSEELDQEVERGTRADDNDDAEGDDGNFDERLNADGPTSLSLKPPLKLLEDAAVVEALWTGKQSMMRRLLGRLEAVYHEKCVIAGNTADSSSGEEEEEEEYGGGESDSSGGDLSIKRRKSNGRKKSSSQSPRARPVNEEPLPAFVQPHIIRERILVWDNRNKRCLSGRNAPFRDELVDWLRQRPGMEVYTGQPCEFGIFGENGILADQGLPRNPNDTIALWDAIKRRRADEKPLRKHVAGVIATRPHLFLYAGQDFKDGEAWPGAREARGVADAYAAVKALAGGDPNERIPMWNTVTNTILLGKSAPKRSKIHNWMRHKSHMQLYTGQDHDVKEEVALLPPPAPVGLPAESPDVIPTPLVQPTNGQHVPPPPCPPPQPQQPTAMDVDTATPSIAAFAQGGAEHDSIAADQVMPPSGPTTAVASTMEQKAAGINAGSAAAPALAIVMPLTAQETPGASAAPGTSMATPSVAPDGITAQGSASSQTNGYAGDRVDAGHANPAFDERLRSGSPDAAAPGGSSSADVAAALPSAQESMVANQSGWRDGQPPHKSATPTAAPMVAGEGKTKGDGLVPGEISPSPVPPASPTSSVEVGDETDPQALAETAVSVIHAAAESAAQGILYGTNSSSPNGWVALLQPSPADLKGATHPAKQQQPEQALNATPALEPATRAQQNGAIQAPTAVLASQHYPHMNGYAAPGGAALYNNNANNLNHSQLQSSYNQTQQNQHYHDPWVATAMGVNHMHHPTVVHQHHQYLHVSPAAMAGIRSGSPLNVLAGGESPSTQNHAPNTSPTKNDAPADHSSVSGTNSNSPAVNGGTLGIDAAIADGTAVAAAAVGAAAAAAALNPYALQALPPLQHAVPRVPQREPHQPPLAGYGYAPPGAQYAFYGPAGGLWHHHGAAASAWGGGFGGQMAQMWSPYYGGTIHSGGGVGGGYGRHGGGIPGIGSGRIDLRALAQSLPQREAAVKPTDEGTNATSSGHSKSQAGSDVSAATRPIAAVQAWKGFAGGAAADKVDRCKKFDYGNDTVKYGPEDGRSPTAPRAQGVKDGVASETMPALGVPRRRDDCDWSDWPQQIGRKKLKGKGGFAVRGRGGAVLKKQPRKLDQIEQRHETGATSDPCTQRSTQQQADGTMSPPTIASSSVPAAAQAARVATLANEIEVGDNTIGNLTEKAPATETAPDTNACPAGAPQQSVDGTPGDSKPAGAGSVFASGAAVSSEAKKRLPSGPPGRRMMYSEGVDEKVDRRVSTKAVEGMFGSVSQQEVGDAQRMGSLEERVRVFNHRTMRWRTGHRCPQRKSLGRFLKRNPHFTLRKEQKPGEVPAPTVSVPEKEQSALLEPEQEAEPAQPAPPQAMKKLKAGALGRCRPLGRRQWIKGKAVIKDVRAMLENEKVPHRGVLRQLLLRVRELLLTLRPLPNARHGAAADVLLLLAHTKTFAEPTPYATVEGDPVQVQAKELGNNVPRSVLRRYLLEKRAKVRSAAGREKRAAALSAACGEKSPSKLLKAEVALDLPADHTPDAKSSKSSGPKSNGSSRTADEDEDDDVVSRNSDGITSSIKADRQKQGSNAEAQDCDGKDGDTLEAADAAGDADDDVAPATPKVVERRESIDTKGGAVVDASSPVCSEQESETTTPCGITAGGDRDACRADGTAAGDLSSAVASANSPEGSGSRAGGGFGTSVKNASGDAAGKGGNNTKKKSGRGNRWKAKLTLPTRKPRPEKLPAALRPETFLSGQEVVYEHRPVSGPYYVLAQLLQWHNHEEGRNALQNFDEKLRGCVHLPDVLGAYEGTGVYGEEHRIVLMSYLEEPEKRKHPWPSKLDSAFGIESASADDDTNNKAAGNSTSGGDKQESATKAVGDCKDTDIVRAEKGTHKDSEKGGKTAGEKSGGGGRGAASDDVVGVKTEATAAVSVSPASKDAGRATTGGKGRNSTSGKGSKGGRRGVKRAKTAAAAAGFGKPGVGASAGGVGGGAAEGGMVLLGSPMVDATLEDTRGLQAVIEVLKVEMGIIAPTGEGGEGADGVGGEGSRVVVKMQEDQPQNTHRTPWVQCDGCYKWRKMPWFVNTELLGEKFFCADNKWNLEEASCEAPAEEANEDVSQMSVIFSGTLKVTKFEVGDWLDIWCHRTSQWYPAKVMTVQANKKRIRVHFHKWQKRYDEWISTDPPDRIAKIHAHTQPVLATATSIGLKKGGDIDPLSETASDGGEMSDDSRNSHGAASAASVRSAGTKSKITPPAARSTTPASDDFVYYKAGKTVGKASLSREERTAARLNRSRLPCAPPVGGNNAGKKLNSAAAGSLVETEGKAVAKAAAATVRIAGGVNAGGGGGVSLSDDWTSVASIAERELVFGAGAGATSPADRTMEYARVMWARAQLNRINNGSGTESPLTSLPERSLSSSGSPRGGFGMGQDEARGTLVGLATCRRPPSPVVEAGSSAPTLSPKGVSAALPSDANNNDSGSNVADERVVETARGDSEPAVAGLTIEGVSSQNHDHGQPNVSLSSPRGRSGNRQSSPRVCMKRKTGSPSAASRGKMMTPHAAMMHHNGERDMPMPVAFSGSYYPQQSPTASGSPLGNNVSHHNSGSAVGGSPGGSGTTQSVTLRVGQDPRLSTPPPQGASQSDRGQEGATRSGNAGDVVDSDGLLTGTTAHDTTAVPALAVVAPRREQNGAVSIRSAAAKMNTPIATSASDNHTSDDVVLSSRSPKREKIPNGGSSTDEIREAPVVDPSSTGTRIAADSRSLSDEEAVQSRCTLVASSPRAAATPRPRLPWNPARGSSANGAASASDAGGNVVLGNNRLGLANGSVHGQQAASGPGQPGNGTSPLLRKRTRVSRG